MLQGFDSLNAINRFVRCDIDLNAYIIKKICKRVYSIFKIDPLEIFSIMFLSDITNDINDIQRQIGKTYETKRKLAIGLLDSTAKQTYLSTKPYYAYRGLPFQTFKNNEQMRDGYIGFKRDAMRDIMNNNICYTFYDTANPSVVKSYDVLKTYNIITDMARNNHVMGMPIESMSRILRQLVQNGMKLNVGNRYYKTPSISRNLINNKIRDARQTVLDICGEQYYSDGVEISVHQNCALDHLPIQGHRFTNFEFSRLQYSQPFKDLEGNEFDSIERPIGMWNCRHYTYPIIIDLKNNKYTDKQLRQIVNNNLQIYKHGDREMILSECISQQVDYEIQIIQAKDHYIAYKELHNEAMMNESKAKVDKLCKIYETFCKNCNLKPRYFNCKVHGYFND